MHFVLHTQIFFIVEGAEGKNIPSLIVKSSTLNFNCFSKKIIHDFDIHSKINYRILFDDVYLAPKLPEASAISIVTQTFHFAGKLLREMATTNFTGKEKTIQRMVCTAGLTAGIHGQLRLISALNIFFSITASLGNALILAALRKESSLHPPSKLLLRSLATTDLCVGLISQPLFVTFLMSVVNGHWNICRYALEVCFITDLTFCGVSLCTLTAISVDRLLALLLGLRYRQVVTLNRAYVIVITFWIMSTVFSIMYFWNILITFWYGFIGVSLCLATSIFSYTKIFLTLRHHQNQVQDLQQPSQTNQLNIARYRKAVSTALWLQLTLVACYLPFGLAAALVVSSGLSTSVFLTFHYTVTVVFLNSSLNPILYCWKIEEVRHSAKDTIRPVLCCFSS